MNIRIHLALACFVAIFILAVLALIVGLPHHCDYAACAINTVQSP